MVNKYAAFCNKSYVSIKWDFSLNSKSPSGLSCPTHPLTKRYLLFLSPYYVKHYAKYYPCNVTIKYEVYNNVFLLLTRNPSKVT